MPKKRLTVSPKEGLAVLALIKDKTLTDAEVAEIAGCHPKSLYRMPDYQRIRGNLAAQARAGLRSGFEYINRDGDKPNRVFDALDDTEDEDGGGG